MRSPLRHLYHMYLYYNFLSSAAKTNNYVQKHLLHSALFRFRHCHVQQPAALPMIM